MSAAKENLATSTLLVKNLPLDMDQLTDVLTQLRSLPTDMRPFGRRRALLRYSSPEEAQGALHQFQGLVAQERPILAKLFYKEAVREQSVKDDADAQQPKKPRKSATLRKSTQTISTSASDCTPASLPAISNYVRKLFACNANLDFDQPPPPYLRYAYPRITPAILDSISIALMSNTRFYTQVLHLMNRMNLEPPFGPREGKFVPPGEPRDAATQTESVHIGELPPQPTASADESELESSGNEQEASREAAATRAKRKLTSHEEQYRKKARLLLQATLFKKHKAQATAVDTACNQEESTKKLQEVFEAPTEVRPSKIAVHLKPKVESPAVDRTVPRAPIEQQPLAELAPQQRLSAEELKLLPVFKNYTEGTPSNKLYIKNLAKDVTAEDLYSLYARFAAPEHLEVKVMQQGRMKGQAFVTFTELADDTPLDVVGVALGETNGLLLKQKPMVVCFGRK